MTSLEERALFDLFFRVFGLFVHADGAFLGYFLLADGSFWLLVRSGLWLLLGIRCLNRSVLVEVAGCAAGCGRLAWLLGLFKSFRVVFVLLLLSLFWRYADWAFAL